MKRWMIVLICALLLMVFLNSCKVSDADLAAADQHGLATQTGPTWAYSWVTLHCVYDGGTNDMVCIHLDNEDNTTLGSILNSKAAEGWELADIMTSNGPEGMLQTFVFRKSLQ
jgi:hypothetical protein